MSAGSWTKKTRRHRPPLQQSKAQHDRMVALVERMVELNKHVEAAFRPPQQHARLKAASTPEPGARNRRHDAEIDNLVYELYGITDEE